ncbi:MAG: TetR/AcrR family transcriptional regulator [Kiritimatiellales bacterium]|nr:TetR/AcrR family transcriptional regulator [Kiritimatiellales bacterium]
MTTYSTGDKTKKAMVNAAGELAAELGFASVSTRAVAERSGENIGSIHYHFGGKDGLFEAVVRDAMSCCTEKEFHGAIDELSEESTLEDLSKVIRIIIAGEITDMFRSDRPGWHSQVIYQLLQRDDTLYEIFRTEVMDPSMESMNRFFRLIDPNMGKADAFLHAVCMKLPIFAHASYRKALLKGLGEKEYSEAYLQKMEDLLVRQTQLLLGLPDDRKI